MSKPLPTNGPRLPDPDRPRKIPLSPQERAALNRLRFLVRMGHLRPVVPQS
jgi:hypothetical protein